MQINNLNANSINNMAAERGRTETLAPVRSSGFYASKGDIFEGSIKSVDKDKVVLALQNGDLIEARLDSNINLKAGSSVFFQVKSSQGNTIEITPLKDEGANPVILSALANASLDADTRNIELVQNLMQNSLPINSENLSRMGRIIFNNPEVPVSLIVRMDEMHIPVTKENIESFIRFSENNNEIFSEFDSLIDLIPDLINDDTKTSDILKLFSAFTGETAFASEAAASEGEETAFASEAAASEGGETAFVAAEANSGTEMPEQSDGAVKASDEPEMSDGAVKASEGAETEKITDVAAVKASESAVGIPEGDISSADPVINEGAFQNENAFSPDKDLLNEDMTGSVIEDSVNGLLRGIDNIKNDFPLFVKENPNLFNSDGNLKAGKVPDFINSFTEYITSSKAYNLKDVFSRKDFKNLLRQALSERIALKPEDVSRNSVKKLYENILETASKIEQAVSNVSGENGHVTKMISEIRSNVDFINQINNFYNYVQLPLKLFDQNAKGDLYVYTGGKGRKHDKNSLSAFLSLNLTHLGKTDVSVSMSGKNVSVKFYLDDADSARLVSSYLDELDRRLLEKGYRTNFYVKDTDCSTDPVDILLKLNGERSVGDIRRYTFDARA